MKKTALWAAILFISTVSYASAVDSVRVVTFNAYNRPGQRHLRFQRGAEAVWKTDPHLVLLQEIGHGWILWGDALDWIWDKRPEREVWDRAWEWQESNWGLYKNGLAVLSRFPIVSHRYVEMRASNGWDIKGALIADILIDGRPASVVNVHWRSTSSWPVKQSELAQLAELVDSLTPRGPVLLGGDFNWEWGDPDFRAAIRKMGGKSLFDILPEGRYATWTPTYGDRCDLEVEGETHQQLDNVLLFQSPRGPAISFRDAAVIVPVSAPLPSDHCILSADIAWGAKATAPMTAVAPPKKKRGLK